MKALVLLVDLWKNRPDLIQQNKRVTEVILAVLKRACRDKLKVVQFLVANLMSELLDTFAKARNMYAPIIYKALTFILID